MTQHPIYKSWIYPFFMYVYVYYSVNIIFPENTNSNNNNNYYITMSGDFEV